MKKLNYNFNISYILLLSIYLASKALLLEDNFNSWSCSSCNGTWLNLPHIQNCLFFSFSKNNLYTWYQAYDQYIIEQSNSLNHVDTLGSFFNLSASIPKNDPIAKKNSKKDQVTDIIRR